MNRSFAFTSLLKISASALMALTLSVASAQTDKPTVKVLVGFPAGAGADALARIYADALAQSINVNAVVDNKPGAGGLIANQALKSASPESNSLMLTMDHQVVMLPLITKNPGFDLKKDMVPIARLVTFSVCLAVPGNASANSLKDFIDAAKADPKNANFGVPAPGSQAHFAGFVVGKHFNAPLNAVPYRGAAPAVADLLGAQISSIIVPCDALLEHRKAGKVKILAIAADKRSPALPDVPTFDEQGVKMPTDNFVAVYASATLKPELLKNVLDATQKMFQNQGVVNRFNATGMTAAYAGADELRNIVDRGTVFWAEQVKTSKFEPQ